MAAGGKAINLGELAIAIALKTGALEQGLKEVQKKLNDHGKKVRKTGADYDKLAIVAGVAFWKIASAIGSSVKAFNDFNNSMVGLKSIVQGTGASFQEAQGFIDNYIRDGLVPASDAATALKNLLARGFELGEATTIMERFKDSASFGRQASLSLGEAVKSATEGLKNENSILVDNAGVTKNVSVMWKEYAETVGKAVNDLTVAEKRQAELTGIMRETQYQIGDAAKYADQFAGAQAKAAAESLRLSQAYGGALTPALGAFLNVLTPVVSWLADFVKNNPELVATLTLTATAFLGIITVVTAVGAAVKLVTPALAALKLSLAGLMVNPVVLALTALAAVVGIVVTQVVKAKKAQAEYNASLEKFNKIKKEGIQQSQVAELTQERDLLEDLVSDYDEVTQKIEEFNAEQDKINDGTLAWNEAMGNRSDIIFDLIDEQEALNKKLKENNVTYDEAKDRINEYTKAIDRASLKTGAFYNDQARDIAQRNAAIQVTKELISVYNTAKKGSSDWLEAEKKLAEQFPQFSTAAGIKIESIEEITKAQEKAVEAEWKMLMAEVAMTKIKVQSILVEKNAALSAAEAERNALMGPGDARHYARTGMPEAIRQKAEETNNAVMANKKAVDELKSSYVILDELLKTGMDGVTGVTPLDLSGIGKSKYYENAALDTAMKIHNHRVTMDELTKEQEIASLETILRAYAKTADERMDLDERIYQAKQDLRDRDLAATEKAIEDEAKKLADRTTLSERWIDRTKSRGELTTQDEIDAYNRIIKYHKEYLAKIKADTKIAAEDKKKIIQDETQYIQDQQDKILSIQKASVDKAVRAYIEAKQKQYDTEEDLENDRLNAKLKALDKEYSDKERELEAEDRASDLNSLYAQERKYANAATKEGQDKLADIREQIARLQAEATKDELEAEKAERRAAIEQDIQDNQDKYKRLNADLESEKEKMLAAAVDYAKKANTALVDGQTAIAKSLSDVIRQFDTQSTSLITQGMDKLRRLIDGYKSIMEGISLSPNFELAGTGGLSVNAAGSKSDKSVVINDYGDKILSGVDDIQDYGKELVIGANHAARG